MNNAVTTLQIWKLSAVSDEELQYIKHLTVALYEYVLFANKHDFYKAGYNFFGPAVTTMNVFWDVALCTFVYIWIIVPPEHWSCLPNYIAAHPIRHEFCYVSFVNCPNFFNTQGNSKNQSNKHCGAENFMLILMYTWHICSKLYPSDHW